MTEYPPVAHAKAYAAVGLPVFPVAPRGKAPLGILVPRGLHDATTDPAVIERWWSRRPDANIGLVPPERTIVLDVDPRNGGSLTALGVTEHDTWCARTGSGGWHLWYRYGEKVRGKVDGIAGVDVKSHNGYLVAPPSVHPNGQRYEWLNKQPIASLPAHLRGRVRVPVMPLRSARASDAFRNGSGSGDALVRYVANAPAGYRNDRLFWATCRAVAEGAGPELLDAIAGAAAGIGLPEIEIRKTMQSAERRTTA